jgi:uncharacterized protein YkwD
MARSREAQVGRWVILLGKLAVVALALVGVAYLAPISGLPSELGAGTTPTPGAGPTATATAAPTASPTPTAAPETAAAAAGTSELDRARIETLIHRNVNDFRKQHSLSPIQDNEHLVRIARGHSEEMAMQGYFAHESPAGQTFEDRYRIAGYHCRVPMGDGYLTGGENLYKMTIQGQTVSNGAVARAAVESWRQSAGHRRALLRPQWDDMGIGVYVADSGAETTIYVTQNFC